MSEFFEIKWAAGVYDEMFSVGLRVGGSPVIGEASATVAIGVYFLLIRTLCFWMGDIAFYLDFVITCTRGEVGCYFSTAENDWLFDARANYKKWWH